MAALTSSCLPPSGVHRGVSGGPGRNSRPTAASRLERSHWALPRREEPSSHEAEVHACGPALLAACLRTRARQVAASCPGCPGACEAGQGTGVSTLAQGLRAEAWHSDGPGLWPVTALPATGPGWGGRDLRSSLKAGRPLPTQANTGCGDPAQDAGWGRGIRAATGSQVCGECTLGLDPQASGWFPGTGLCSAGQTSMAATMLELTRGFLRVWHRVQSGPGDRAPPGPLRSGAAGETLSRGVRTHPVASGSQS